MLAVILETADPERLYTGLSLIVSTASAGEDVRVLLGFGALTLAPGAHVVEAEREAFTRTLAALWETTLALCDVRVCGAAAQATAVERELPVTSMPEFVREIGDARLVLV